MTTPYTPPPPRPPLPTEILPSREAIRFIRESPRVALLQRIADDTTGDFRLTVRKAARTRIRVLLGESRVGHPPLDREDRTVTFGGLRFTGAMFATVEEYARGHEIQTSEAIRRLLALGVKAWRAQEAGKEEK